MKTAAIMTKLRTEYFILLLVVYSIGVASDAACLSPCKMFHSWCTNGGICRVKDEACTWYCECPDNCNGFFCEKIVAKNNQDNSTNGKVMHDAHKKKDVSAFDKSKIAQALAGLLLRTEDVTCSENKLLQKIKNKLENTTTPSSASATISQKVLLSTSRQNNTVVSGSTEENLTTMRMEQTSNNSHTTRSFFNTVKQNNNVLEITTPIVKSTFATDVTMAVRAIMPLNVTLRTHANTSSTDLPLTKIIHRNVSLGMFTDFVSTAKPTSGTSEAITNHSHNTLPTVKLESFNNSSTEQLTKVELTTVINLPTDFHSLPESENYTTTEHTVTTVSESKVGKPNTVTFFHSKPSPSSVPQTTLNQATVAPLLEITSNISMRRELKINNETKGPAEINLQQPTTESSNVRTSYTDVSLTSSTDILSTNEPSRKKMSDQMRRETIERNVVAGIGENITHSMLLSVLLVQSNYSRVNDYTKENYNSFTSTSNIGTISAKANSTASGNKIGSSITTSNDINNKAALNMFQDKVTKVMLHNTEATRKNSPKAIIEAISNILNEETRYTAATSLIASTPSETSNGFATDQTTKILSPIRERSGKPYETSSAIAPLNVSAISVPSFTFRTSTSSSAAFMSVSAMHLDRNMLLSSPLTPGSGVFTNTIDGNEKTTGISQSTDTHTLSQFSYASNDIQLPHTNVSTLMPSSSTQSPFATQISTLSINAMQSTATASTRKLATTDEKKGTNSSLGSNDSLVKIDDIPISNSTQQSLTTNMRIDLSTVSKEFSRSNVITTSAGNEDAIKSTSSTPAAETLIHEASQIMPNQIGVSSSAVNLSESEPLSVNNHFGPDAPIEKTLTSLWNDKPTKENSELVEYINLERNKDKIEQTSDLNML